MDYNEIVRILCYEFKLRCVCEFRTNTGGKCVTFPIYSKMKKCVSQPCSGLIDVDKVTLEFWERGWSMDADMTNCTTEIGAFMAKFITDYMEYRKSTGLQHSFKTITRLYSMAGDVLEKIHKTVYGRKADIKLITADEKILAASFSANVEKYLMK